MTTTPEAYVHLSTDETTLTFYYDTLRADRDGTTWGISDKETCSLLFSCSAWAGHRNSRSTTVLTAVFDASFRDFRPTTTAGWFYELHLLESIEGLEYLNTSQVKDMKGMFFGCESLSALDLSSFDTSNVASMSMMRWGMFSGCKSLTSLDLSSFDTSKVTGMEGMFSGCVSLTALDLSSFDTSKVTDMREMFSRCASLTSLDLSSFDTSVVWGMSGMFSGCASLTSLDLSSFDTSQVTDMSSLFSGCGSLTSLDLSSFDTSQVTKMSSLFSGCGSLTSLDLTSFDTSKVTDMEEMFSGCASLTSLDLSSFDTSQVGYMRSMFSGCGSLPSLDFTSFDTSKVTDMEEMFSGCGSLTTIYCNLSWSARHSDDMFSGCNSLRGAATNVGYDVSMANPETGYFTKNVLPQEDEAYVQVSADKKTLTFYFDRARNVRRCCAWLSNEVASKTPPSTQQRWSTTTPYAQIFPILTGYDGLANYLSLFMSPLQSEQ